MENIRFTEQMQAYGQWKADLTKGINYYQKWLDAHKMSSPEEDLRIYEILESLRSDHLTIAFVAEFARGKTELINSIFFSEYDRRLLPSEAGRTTMCPTELFYDSQNQSAYIRLLPIETRLTDTSIGEYKSDPIHWTTIELDLNDADSMAEAFKEIVKVKKVSTESAKKLGLFSENDKHMLLPDGSIPAEIEIPLWRHAQISFPHPLLKQGLMILDTPGLNAVGSEPELTLNMLPSAQAVMFIMAADTGVTKSDLDMWQQNVKPLAADKSKGLIVVLNKIDTLWDELKTAEDIEKAITTQCRSAARTLDIDPSVVVPTSAQKGLLAKIRHDTELLTRSNILTLENILASEILPQKQHLVSSHVQNEIGAMIKETHSLLGNQYQVLKKQLNELNSLSDKNNDVIEHLMKKTREEQVAYYKNIESFQANKKLLTEQCNKLQNLLNLEELDKLINKTREAMEGTWTTHGLKMGMKTFFDGVNEMIGRVDQYSEQLNLQVTTVYRKFEQDHGMTDVKPTLFSTSRYVEEFKKLHAEGEAFRTSPVTVAMEQSFVIKKFFITLASHARHIFYKANRDADKWSKAVMSPLVRQIKIHKDQMEQRLENLRKVNESRDTLGVRIEELSKQAAAVEKQYREISSILTLIKRPLDGNARQAAKKAAKAASA